MLLPYCDIIPLPLSLRTQLCLLPYWLVGGSVPNFSFSAAEYS